jgi:tetratricopeptide (TPR) repeat protein
VDGVRYFQQGQYPVALQRFDAALTIDPQNADTYYNKAAVYHRMGLATRDQNTLNQAESLYNQCLNLNPNHVDCHRGLAVLLAETGRTDKSVALAAELDRAKSAERRRPRGTRLGYTKNRAISLRRNRG